MVFVQCFLYTAGVKEMIMETEKKTIYLNGIIKLSLMPKDVYKSFISNLEIYIKEHFKDNKPP